MLDYNSLESLTPEEFEKATVSADELRAGGFTKSDDADLRKIERLLDVREGTLKGLELYIEQADCACGELLKPSDLVLTSLIDANHSKSFVLHTLLGTKLIVNPKRPVRCSHCGMEPRRALGYGGPGTYGCPP